VDAAALVEPYCWDVIAVSPGYRVKSTNGPLCRSLECACDINSDGAVGLNDVVAALRSRPMDLGRVGRCLRVLGGRC
jgi:hypothetical protein